METAFFNSDNLQNIIIINPQIVWIVFIITLIIFIIISAVIFYHWFAYNYTSKNTLRSIIIYLVGSGFFIAISIVSAIIYTVSI
ncbi:hypothetical protein KJ557_02385 [Patescibacteria group bacterium]|nr:hypothetical protein [Patescibacteria group bacterium]